MKGLAFAALLIGGATMIPMTSARAQPDRGPPTSECVQGVLTLHLLRAEGNPPPPNIVAQWEATNKCTKVEVTEVPFGQLADKISVLAASGNPPDIIGYDGPNTQSYAAAGILLPLDKYLPPHFKDDVLPATLQEHSYNSKVYSPGIQQVALALFYNKDMTDAVGITPPSTLDHGWTWPQAIDAFKKCQKETNGNVSVWGLAPSRFGNGTPGFVYRDLLFLRSAGDPTAPKDSSLYKTYFALSPDGNTADGWLNTPEAVAALKVYQSMFNEMHITPKGAIPNAFQDRRACFTIDINPLVGALQKNDPGFKWGVTPLPYFRTPIVHTGSTTLAVMAKSRHPDEAANFVVAISTGAFELAYAKQARIIPPEKSIYSQMDELRIYPTSIFDQEVRDWGHPRPISPHSAQYDKVVTDALRDIAYGADPKARLDQAVRTLQPILSH
jgi:fructooligosaccharide transport system substrate-binding protein